MKNLIIVFVMLAFLPSAYAGGRLNVVATQTTYADLVRKIGGDKVEVVSIASPKFNVHFIQPKPSDVRKVSKADLYVHGGMDLEAWSDPLLEAAGKPQLFRNAERNLDLSQGLHLLNVPSHQVTRAEGDIHLFGNPHIQMNPENARVMAGTILTKLKSIDPSNAAVYEANAKSFLLRLDKKIIEWKSLCLHCRGSEVISYHDDFVYMAHFLGIKAEQFLEPKPGVPPTPKHLQFLEDYAKTHKVKAIVLPTYFPKRDAEKIAARLGIKVVVMAHNAGEIPGTEDILSFYDYNITHISEALK